MRVLLVIAKILVIVGGLNWGLIGVFQYNLVDAMFGEGSAGSQVVYIAVGVAALLTIIDLFVARYADRRAVVREPEHMRTTDELRNPADPADPAYGVSPLDRGPL